MNETRSFPSNPRSIKHARQFVANCVLDPSVVDDATLMVSELTTNCLRHAQSGFTVTITADASATLRVDVSDHGHSNGEPHLRHPAPNAPTGRGLQIVAALANDWGTRINDSGGHTVWFTLSTEAPEPGFSNTVSSRRGA